MYYLVLFENPTQTKRTSVEAAASKRSREGGPLKLHNETQQQLKQELIATREYLQAIIEEQEATNEELRSANEEALSSNEELQSTNEELETAKEELQSANEELTTVNEEIQSRNIELSQLNNDLTNLLSTVNLPILMLGSDLRIRRFTPMAEKLMNLIPTDIGRPIKDINSNLLVTDLEEMLIDVIDNITTKEREVHDKDGRRYIMRVRPYKTPENRIEGAVMILLDIDKGSAGGGGEGE
jgi:two-component system CheB/CheR fusion protein